jgi:hypothetical protein
MARFKLGAAGRSGIRGLDETGPSAAVSGNAAERSRLRLRRARLVGGAIFLEGNLWR